MSLPALDQPMVLSLLGGGFVAAFMHAALPTHWLPFVLVGRAQHWTAARLTAAVIIAGLAHVASTAVVGTAVAAAGLALSPWIGGLVPYLSAGLLTVMGLFYLSRAVIRQPAGVSGGLPMAGPRVSDGAALSGLVAVMALSPGEVLLPLYLSGATHGWFALVLLTLAFAIGTVGGMLILTMLARAGFSILRLERWARYEGAILGLALLLLAALVLTGAH